MSIEQRHLNELYKKSGSEIEAMSHNLELAVINELSKLGKQEIIEQIKKNGILELERKKFVEMGELSKKSNPDFDIDDYFVLRVKKLVEEIEEKYDYKN